MRTTLAGAVMMLLLLTAANAQPGGNGGGRRGGMSSVDRDWAVLCFEINISADQIAKLRPTFQWAWKCQGIALKSAMTSHDFESVGKTMASVTSTVRDRIKIVLTAAQYTQWTKYNAEQAKLRAQRRAQMGGGPGAQGHGGTNH
jgi:hypothetical protein